MKLFLGITAVTLFVLFISGCNRKKNDNSSNIDTMAVEKPVDIKFNPDSAYAFTAAQCAFGPRVMNSAAHDLSLIHI